MITHLIIIIIIIIIIDLSMILYIITYYFEISNEIVEKMESNRDEACRCIELTKLYIKKKHLDNALKFSIKAHKLFPTTETKREFNNF